MADNKSCEGKNVVWKCLDCRHEHIFEANDYRQDGLKCYECGGIVTVSRFTNEPVTSKTGELKVNIDLSQAIKGVKAWQRELRKTTAALKELEEAYNKVKPVAEQCGVHEQEVLAALLSVGRGEMKNESNLR